jgi:Putative Na+/H+ antiporter
VTVRHGRAQALPIGTFSVAGRSRPWITALALLAAGFAPAGALAAAGPGPEGAPSFPPALARYEGEGGLSLAAVLANRIRVEPLNLVATALFALAILHTFAASRITAWSHRLRGGHQPGPGGDAQARDALEAEPSQALAFKAEVLHFLGEVEVVFGVWVIPLFAAIAIALGWWTAEAFIARGVDFTEPIFVAVIMAVASTRPVLEFAEGVIGRVAALGGRTPVAWWLAVLTIAPVLGSFITEPAAMIIGALLLGRHVFEHRPSARLRYATLGLLFVNISVGGTLTHFAAPPVVMVAPRWGWDSGFMLSTFGWKALIGILAATGLYVVWLRGELAALRRADGTLPPAIREAAPAPAWVIAVHLGFLAWTVLVGHTPVLFVGGFLVFLAFTHATAPYQSSLNLRPALLVGFFLAGLVVHGALQQWWIEPVLSRLPAAPLFVGSIVLTAFNDNAAITYLASLVPAFTPELRYAVVAGAVTGGGLTVIANAPNPAGQAILGRYFAGGISPLGLVAGAALPTFVMAACFFFL